MKYLLALSALLTVLTGLLFNARLNLPYNSEGNYFDETTATVYHQHSVDVYGLITFVFLLLTMVAGYFTIKNYRRKISS